MTCWDLYCRLSKAHNGSTETVDRQDRDMTRAVKPPDTIGKRYKRDNDRSAWKTSVIRKDFEELLRCIEEGTSAEGIFVWHLDRYTRQMWDLERLLHLVETGQAKSGFLLRSLQGTWDLRIPEDRSALRKQCIHAQDSSTDTSRRVRDKLTDRIAYEVKPLGGWTYATNPDGEILLPQAKVLRELARRRALGEEWPFIAEDFNARDDVPPLRSGQPFTRTNLRAILYNPRNAGIIMRNGEAVGRLPQAIFTEEEWAKITAMRLGAKRGRPISGRYLLTGLIECGVCGGKMRGVPIGGRGANPDGSKRQVYKCHGVGCSRTITAAHVEKLVIQTVMTALSNPDYVGMHKTARIALDREADSARRKLELARASLAEVMIKEGTGLLDELSARRAKETLGTQITTMQAKLTEVSDPGYTVTRLTKSTLAQWETSSTEQRRQLVSVVVRAVVVNPPSPRRPTGYGPFGGGSGFDPDRVQIELRLPKATTMEEGKAS